MKFDRDSYSLLFNEASTTEPTPSCSHIYIIIDGYHTCSLCGQVDIHRYSFTDSIRQQKKKLSIYSRKTYFLDKLRLMVGIKQSQDAEYTKIIDSLKSQSFSSIFELKKIMRKKKYHKYYKYIYNIYYDIRGIRLINLSHSDIDHLLWKFLMLENQFKKYYKNKSNLLSYNIIIYSLIKKYNHPCYKNIILPKNKRKLLKNIEKLVSKLVT